MKKNLERQESEAEKCTANVFRIAYYLAKMNRLFSDHENLIELHQLNGLSVGSILHSRFTANCIISHIASEMKTKTVQNIVSSSSKLSVLIDESTTSGHKSVMIVHIRASFNEGKPIFAFLDLVELESQTSECIKNALIKRLHNAGFTEDYLQKHWGPHTKWQS